MLRSVNPIVILSEVRTSAKRISSRSRRTPYTSISQSAHQGVLTMHRTNSLWKPCGTGVVGVLRLRIPIRFANRHAPLRMTLLIKVGTFQSEAVVFPDCVVIAPYVSGRRSR
jgi:hypothetical protein